MGLVVEPIEPEEGRQECHICTVARGAAGMDPQGGPRATFNIKSPNSGQEQKAGYDSCPYHLERTINCLMKGEKPSPTVMPQPPLWPLTK